jgi:hypothetical protein
LLVSRFALVREGALAFIMLNSPESAHPSFERIQ